MIEQRTMYLDSYLSYRYTCWLEYNTNSLAIFSLSLLFFLLQFRDGARRRRQRLQEVWGQHHVSHSGWSQRHLLLVRLQPPVPQPFPQVGTCVAYWQMNHPNSGNQQARISNGYCCMTNPVRKSCTSLLLSGMFTHLLSQVFFGQCNHLWICTKGTNYFDGLLTFIYKSDLYVKSALKSFGNQPGRGRKPASNSRSKAVANATDENKINKICLFEAFFFFFCPGCKILFCFKFEDMLHYSPLSIIPFCVILQRSCCQDIRQISYKYSSSQNILLAWQQR